MKDIENIKREDCLEYFRTFYAPNNATLYLSGDFDPKEALALIKKYYADIKPGPGAPPRARRRAGAEGRAPRRGASPGAGAVADDRLARPSGATDPDTLVLDVLQYALSVGQSSRLTRALVFEQEARRRRLRRLDVALRPGRLHGGARAQARRRPEEGRSGALRRAGEGGRSTASSRASSRRRRTTWPPTCCASWPPTTAAPTRWAPTS